MAGALEKLAGSNYRKLKWKDQNWFMNLVDNVVDIGANIGEFFSKNWDDIAAVGACTIGPLVDAGATCIVFIVAKVTKSTYESVTALPATAAKIKAALSCCTKDKPECEKNLTDVTS